MDETINTLKFCERAKQVFTLKNNLKISIILYNVTK